MEIADRCACLPAVPAFANIGFSTPSAGKTRYTTQNPWPPKFRLEFKEKVYFHYADDKQFIWTDFTFRNKEMLLHCSEIALVMNMAQHYILLLKTTTESIVSETSITNHSLHIVCLASSPRKGVTGTSSKPKSRFKNSFFPLSCLSAELCHPILFPVLHIYTHTT